MIQVKRIAAFKSQNLKDVTSKEPIFGFKPSRNRHHLEIRVDWLCYGSLSMLEIPTPKQCWAIAERISARKMVPKSVKETSRRVKRHKKEPIYVEASKGGVAICSTETRYFGWLHQFSPVVPMSNPMPRHSCRSPVSDRWGSPFCQV